MQSAAQAIAALEGTIGAFESKVDLRVQTVKEVTSRIKETVDKIYNSINQFKSDIISQEEVQLAQENIMRLEQIIKEEFGGYDNIRKTVMGIVRDFDINLVRNKSIKEISEELWLSNSNYWLSYALISLAAWVNDSKEIADSAISECLRHDKVKTTLFFCLLNFRFERMSISRKWFNTYLETVDPEKCQYELAILLLAFLSGVFGKDKELESIVNNIIKTWIIELDNDANTTLALSQTYSNYIFNLTVLKDFEYPTLKEHMEDYNNLCIDYLNVSKYELLINAVNEVISNNDDNKLIDYNKKIDYILNHLISDFDKEEQDIKNQQRYFKFVIQNQGQIANAKEQYAESERLRNESFNIGKQMIRWFIYDDENTNPTVRIFALQNTKKWLIEAIDKWKEKLSIEKVKDFILNIDNRKYIISNNYDDVKNEMIRYYDSNRNQFMYFNTINILLVIAIVISIILCFIFKSLYPMIGIVLSVAILIFRVFKSRKDYPIRVANAKSILENSINEIEDFKEYYFEQELQYGKLINIINEV